MCGLHRFAGLNRFVHIVSDLSPENKKKKESYKNNNSTVSIKTQINADILNGVILNEFKNEQLKSWSVLHFV